MKTKDIIKMAVIFKIVFNLFNFIRDNDLVWHWAARWFMLNGNAKEGLEFCYNLTWERLFGKKRARAMVNRILKEIEAEEE